MNDLATQITFVVAEEPAIPDLGDEPVEGVLREMLGVSAEDYRSEDGGISGVEFRADLEQATKRLSPQQHQAFYYWLQGYSQEEVAALIGVDQSTVSRRLRRAFAEIRAVL